jgi:phosphoribosyl-AMP cyclohydrolase / phosphoribosyl-ATP pyrophosphohydrolase
MISIESIDFDKMNGLVPAIVQDAVTKQVLMLGFMDRESLLKTLEDNRLTFFSRTRNSLWQKGETSGNYLEPVSIRLDCDADTLLIRANPAGPVCHTGTFSCFGEERDTVPMGGILFKLNEIILERQRTMPESSYTAKLFAGGLPRIAQKVGEEAVETVIAALGSDREDVKEEAADLLYHLLVLIAAKNITIQEIEEVLGKRM